MRTMGFSTKGDVAQGLSDYKKAPGMARALINSGWLLQFRVFNELRQEDITATEEETTAAKEESAWARRLPPGRHGARAAGGTRHCSGRRARKPYGYCQPRPWP